MLWEFELATGDLLIKIFVAGSPEGELAAKHGVEKNAARPDIRRRAHILALEDDLRTHVAWRAAEDLEADVGTRAAAEPKINQLYLVLLSVDNDVLKLDVSVRDVSLVQVRERAEQLFDDSLGFVFGESALGRGLKVRV